MSPSVVSIESPRSEGEPIVITHHELPRILALHAAADVIERRLKDLGAPDTGKHAVPACKLTIDLAGGELSQAAGCTQPKYATFPMDLGCAYLLSELPPRQRPAKLKKMFKLFEQIEAQDEKALEQKAALDEQIAKLKACKKQIGEIAKRGALKVVAVGSISDDLPPAA